MARVLRGKRLKKGELVRVTMENTYGPNGFYGVPGDIVEFISYANYKDIIYFNFVHLNMDHPSRQRVPISECHPDDWGGIADINSPEGVEEFLMAQDKIYGMWCGYRGGVERLVKEYQLDQILDQAEDLL